MGFRGEAFRFDSPQAAVVGIIAALGCEHGEARGMDTEVCTLDEARGRVLAAPVLADRDSPAFDYAAMDGYAVRRRDLGVLGPFGDVGASRRYPVAAESRIGQQPPTMRGGPGEPCVVRIVTGAPIPDGADAIIKREDLVEHSTLNAPAGTGEQDSERVGSISVSPAVLTKIREGEHIRRRGENIRSGQVVLEQGTLVSAAAVGTLAAVGATEIQVRRKLRVAIITTGDELVPPSVRPGPYELRNSNAAALRGILSSRAWLVVNHTIHVADDAGLLRATLSDVLQQTDAIVLSGGVSMGHRDPVRSAVEAVAAVVYHGLPQRPGKPMLAAIATSADGVVPRKIPLFGLPGNPISSMVTCTRLVVPVLLGLVGAARPHAVPRVRIANPDHASIDLWWHRLVRLTDSGEAELVDGRGSGDIIAGGRGDGFIEVPPRGSPVEQSSTGLYPYYSWTT